MRPADGVCRSLALVLLLCGVHSVLAVKGTTAVSPNAVVTTIQSFGFEMGGTITLSGTGSSEAIRASACTAGEWKRFVQDPSSRSLELLCSSHSSTRCEIDNVPLAPLMVQEHEVANSDLYHVFLINCGDRSSRAVSKMGVEYHLVNPGEMELSVGDIGLPRLFAAATGIWFALLVYFTLDLCVTRYLTREVYRRAGSLVAMLFVVVLCKLVVSAMWLAYWSILQASGRSHRLLFLSAGGLFAASEAFLLTVLTSVAAGWRITRDSVPRGEFKSVLIGLILLLSTLLFFSLYNDSYYFFALMILYFFMLPKVFSTASKNGSVLHTQALLLSLAIERAPRDSEEMRNAIETLMKKVKALKTIRLVAALYFVVVLLKTAFRMFLPYNWNYLNYVLNECSVFVFMVVILVALRPQRLLFDLLPPHYLQLLDSQVSQHQGALARLRAYLASEAASSGPSFDSDKVVVIRYPQKEEVDEVHRMKLGIGVEEDYTDFFTSSGGAQ